MVAAGRDIDCSGFIVETLNSVPIYHLLHEWDVCRVYTLQQAFAVL